MGKQPRIDTPRKITTPESVPGQKGAELAEQRRHRRLFAPRLGWGGRYGGRVAV
ncbi:hypothetical protein ACTU45_25180 [Streptomyces sp. 24-1644]|uniref:hypothetical protein n=1 Tax=Streptomyces sp. 24-1644 TaxID=3457315 RepID=UPI003FA6C28A